MKNHESRTPLPKRSGETARAAAVKVDPLGAGDLDGCEHVVSSATEGAGGMAASAKRRVYVIKPRQHVPKLARHMAVR